jgi:hypothetical protein
VSTVEDAKKKSFSGDKNKTLARRISGGRLEKSSRQKKNRQFELEPPALML